MALASPTTSSTMSDSMRVAAWSHSPLSSRFAIDGSQRSGRSTRRIQDDAWWDVLWRTTHGDNAPYKASLRTTLSNHCHRRRRQRLHSFRFNFFLLILLLLLLLLTCNLGVHRVLLTFFLYFPLSDFLLVHVFHHLLSSTFSFALYLFRISFSFLYLAHLHPFLIYSDLGDLLRDFFLCANYKLNY